MIFISVSVTLDRSEETFNDVATLYDQIVIYPTCAAVNIFYENDGCFIPVTLLKYIHKIICIRVVSRKSIVIPCAIFSLCCKSVRT